MMYMNKLNDIVFPNIYNKLDLHGQSKDLARVAINDFIEDNIKMKNEIIVIVHGIGTGALREETQNTLKNNKNVLYYKQDNNNEGQTLVQLRSDIMNKNGFTLIEVLAVVVILSLLMLIITPNLLNSIKNREGQITEAQQEMIIESAKLYLDAGFEPLNIDELTGWKILKRLTDHIKLNSFDEAVDEEMYDKRNIEIERQLNEMYGIDNYTYSVWDINGLHDICVYYNGVSYYYKYYEENNNIRLEKVTSKTI